MIGTMRGMRDERGASVVALAMTLLVLMGMSGLTVDVGHWYHVRARLQSIGDSAALAGAVWLPDATRATAEAQAYLAMNGIASPEVVTCTPVGSSPVRFEVQLGRTAGPYFTAALGISQVQVMIRSVAEPSARSTSGSGPPTGNVLGFAVYAGREFAPPMFTQPEETKVSGSGNVIKGDVHVNGSFDFAGQNNSITGKISATSSRPTRATAWAPTRPRMPRRSRCRSWTWPRPRRPPGPFSGCKRKAEPGPAASRPLAGSL